MNYRKFGRAGWKVSEIGYGMWGMGGWTGSDDAVSTIIPGMRKLKHVESNIAAGNAGPLPAELHASLRPHRWDRQPTQWSQ